MERTEAFKKIMVMFKRGDITPQQLGTLMSQYYERFVVCDVPPVEPSIAMIEIFDGKLDLG
jgi:hypothetical protein